MHATNVRLKCCFFWLPAVFMVAGFFNAAQAQNTSDQEKPLMMDITLLASQQPVATLASDQEKPQMLDMKRFFPKPENTGGFYGAFTYGEQVLEGMPFNIVGQGCLYGQKGGGNPPTDPYAYMGIRVDRKFDMLYLLHGTFWPDVEEQIIAYISLNYADGSKYIVPIRYGVHVRDTYRMPAEEKELLTDPDSKVCWRHPPVQWDAPLRLFKTKLENPIPEKVVETIDVISARSLASYNLQAITVANASPGDSTGKLSGEGPVRKFDGKLLINVVDNATGKPIEGALVDFSKDGLSASPFYTSAEGKGTFRYPVGETNNISTTVTKKGYIPQSGDWSGGIPNTYTFRLQAGN